METATRVEAVDAQGRHVRFREKATALSLTLDTSTVYTFERTGRLYGAYRQGVNFRRSLDNRVLMKKRDPDSVTGHDARVLDPSEAAEVLSAIHDDVRGARSGFEQAGPDAHSWLDRILHWSPAELSASGRLFESIYSTVGILPPDQYMALVIQTSVGCRWNRCTFCDFYRDVPFRLRTEEELDAHLTQVLDFMGEGLLLRRSLFLGDADALSGGFDHISMCVGRIASRMKSADSRLAKASYAGFAEVPSILGLRPEELREMERSGLARLYVGLETGYDPLRRAVAKRGVSAQAVRAVRHLREAGIGVGVIVLAGIGGEALSDAHVSSTADTVERMELGKDDLVYLSPLVDGDNVDGDRGSGRNAALVREEMGRFRDGLRRIPATVTVYDVQRFIY